MAVRCHSCRCESMEPSYYLSDVRLDRPYPAHKQWHDNLSLRVPASNSRLRAGIRVFCTPSPQALTPTPRTSPATKHATDPPQLPRVLVAYPPTKMSLFFLSYTAIPFRSSTWLVVPHLLPHLVARPLPECRTCSPFSFLCSAPAMAAMLLLCSASSPHHTHTYTTPTSPCRPCLPSLLP